jgi:hypothetical protein
MIAGMVLRSCKVLSAVAGVVLLSYGTRMMSLEFQSALRASALIVLGLTFGLNLLRLSSRFAFPLALLHGVVGLYVSYVVWNMARLAMGEAGSKAGLWRFFSPLVIVIAAAAISVLCNVLRGKAAGQAA